MRRVAVPLTLLIMSGAVLITNAEAQEAAPLVRGLLTGYGSVSYSAEPDNGYANNFTATLSPLLLHQVGSSILFEAEMDLELEDASTSLHLEHAQVHYLGFKNLQLTAGMFHVPFGIWMHSSWINRMPTPPLLYQDTHGGPPHDALLPILFDVGVMARPDRGLPRAPHGVSALSVGAGASPRCRPQSPTRRPVPSSRRYTRAGRPR